MAPTERPADAPSPGIALPAVTVGFGAAVVLWIVWWLMHIPALATPPQVAVPVLIATLLVACAYGASRAPRAGAVRIALLGGLVSGVLNLLVLGSKVVVQPASTDEMDSAANQLRPDAAAIVVGFLLASAAAGAIGGLVGRRFTRATPQTRAAWLGRLATTTALSMIPLIVVGGLVTSTESGMAVPDGITSYGAVSFLFPISLMADPRIFLEHSHRLVGTLVGLTAIALALATWIYDRRPLARVCATALLVAVSLQGIFGMIRVDAALAGLAIVHGVSAQLVFAFAVWTSAILSPSWASAAQASPGTLEAATRARGKAVGALHVLFVQLALGAVSRHLDSNHALWTHIAVAFGVVVMIIITGASMGKADRADPLGRSLARLGDTLVWVVGIQFLLGFVAFAMIATAEAPRPIPTADELADAPPIALGEAMATTAHQANGALLLALTTLAAVWAARIRRAARTSPTPGN